MFFRIFLFFVLTIAGIFVYFLLGNFSYIYDGEGWFDESDIFNIPGDYEVVEIGNGTALVEYSFRSDEDGVLGLSGKKDDILDTMRILAFVPSILCLLSLVLGNTMCMDSSDES